MLLEKTKFENILTKLFGFYAIIQEYGSILVKKKNCKANIFLGTGDTNH